VTADFDGPAALLDALKSERLVTLKQASINRFRAARD
jgi:hypothetical protein